jgi:hypothetical protein
MAAKSTKKAGGAALGGSRKSSKKQSKSSSSSKKGISSKLSPSKVAATVKRTGRKTAKAVTGAVDTVAKATGLKSKKR